MSKNAIGEWSTTPDSNTDISGINIGEGCPPSGINDAIRTIMAQLATWYASIVATIAGLMPKTGGAFTGGITGTTAGFSGAITQGGQQVWHAGNLNPSSYQLALGYTPYNATNPNGYISGINAGMVVTALGYAPANAAGQSFSGNILAPTVYATGSNSGYALLNVGDATHTGTVSFRRADGSELGFIGFSNTVLQFNSSAGYSFSGGPMTVTGLNSTGRIGRSNSFFMDIGGYPILVFEVDGNGAPWSYFGFNPNNAAFAWIIRGSVVKQLFAGGFS